MSEQAEKLVKENCELRMVGCLLAEASAHVVREYDGIHRLALKISEWYKVIANTGGRGNQ